MDARATDAQTPAASARRKHTKHVIVTSLVVLAALGRAQDPYPGLKTLENFDFRTRILSTDDLARLKRDTPMGDDQLASIVLLRGVVFGKHGRIFHEPKIQAYLKSRPWYRPDPSFSNSMLNDVERKNIDIIREEESKAHWRVEPGDLRFWRSKKIQEPDEESQYSIAELRIMIAEIEAIHGRAFPNEPLLQKYFDERYWYKRDPSYRHSMLSKVERENMATLSRYESRLRGTSFSPEDVILYSDKRIPQKSLEALSLYELRLTRNAIYALRGRRFKTPWLRDYFANVEWYSPLPAGQKEQLTALDSLNLRAIVAQEGRLHEELVTKPIPHQRLTGLFVEDLRKLAFEIPARHGMVFKDSAMRNYFSAQPWYRANQRFSLKSLSKVERANYNFLLQVAKDTTTQFKMEEG